MSADWATISSLATAGGTLVLAVGLRPREITRFTMIPAKDPDSGERTWYATTARHWSLDRPDPR